MNLKEFQSNALRTFNDQGVLENILHVVLGMVTESGEIADNIKKHVGYGREIDVANIKEELGDLLWYIVVAMHIFDFDIDDVLKTNILKLSKRYPEKFSEFLAENRDLIAERAILEKNNTNI